MVDLSGLDTAIDGDGTLDEDASKFVSNTYNEENYEEWGSNSMAAANGEAGFTSPAQALANRYEGLSEDELSDFTSKHQERTEEAVNNGSYQNGLETFASEDEADDAWAQRFVSGIENDV